MLNQEEAHKEKLRDYENHVKELTESLEEYKEANVQNPELEIQFSAERTAFMTQIDTLKALNTELNQNSENLLGENVQL